MAGDGETVEELRAPLADELESDSVGLAMHDHHGSRAALRIVAGQLRERYVTDAREVAVRWLSPGTAVELAADHVHEVVNVGEVEAISVHVYSPPITDAGFRTDADLEIGPRRT